MRSEILELPSSLKRPAITGFDVSILDVLVPVEHNKKMMELVTQYQLEPGGKRTVSDDVFVRFAQAAQGHESGVFPGGSISNALVTTSKLLGDAADIRFFSAVGCDDRGQRIRTAFKDAGISLLDVEAPHAPQSATSYVLVFPSGERTIVTHSGNAKDVMRPEYMPQEAINKSDIAVVAGSLWQKLSRETPDTVLKQRWEKGSDLWLTLPTNVEFGAKNAEYFRWLIPSTNLVLSNAEELASISGTSNVQQSLAFLHQLFKQNTMLPGSNRESVAFITDGKKGAYVVSALESKPIHIPPIPNVKVVNTLGAGDTAFGGFMAGYLAGLPLEACGQMGVTLAAAKISIDNGARLENPVRDLSRANPELAMDFISAVKKMPCPSFC